jgi:hypothetical protein
MTPSFTYDYNNKKVVRGLAVLLYRVLGVELAATSSFVKGLASTGVLCLIAFASCKDNGSTLTAKY